MASFIFFFCCFLVWGQGVGDVVLLVCFVICFLFVSLCFVCFVVGLFVCFSFLDLTQSDLS